MKHLFSTILFYDGMPHCMLPASGTSRRIDTNITLITAESQLDCLRIRTECQLYHDFPVAETVMVIENIGDEDSRIIELPRVEAFLDVAAPVLAHGIGDTCREDGYNWEHTPLTAPETLRPADGTSCNGAFPYMRLLGRNTSYAVAIGWPARWQADFVPEDGGVRVSAGLARCHTVLQPGEILRTPRLTLMQFDGDEADGINLWRRWWLAHILPRENGEPLPPKLCLHHWNCCGKPEHTAATEENQLEGLQTYLDKGLQPDIWWIDAGWYPCDYDWTRIGSWYPDPARFPNGLGPIGKACREAGAKFLLWFEPERVRPDSELDREHPEWLLTRTNADGAVDANRLLDLGNPAACDWLIERVDSLIKASGVTIYRQDFNFNPAPIWDENEAEDRVGIIENKHAQGYLRYWNTLLERNPGLIIDSCASGGRRNDLETIRCNCIPLHYTDVGYGNHPIKQLQHARMFEWIPYFRAHNMNWLEPDGSYSRAGHTPDRFAYYSAFAPAMTDMTFYTDDAEKFALAKTMTALWRKCAELELTCDYYALTECRKSNEDFYGVQFHDPERSAGFLHLAANSRCEAGEMTVRLHGLKPGAEYTFTRALDGVNEAEVREISTEVLEAGVTFRLPAHTAEIWFYKES